MRVLFTLILLFPIAVQAQVQGALPISKMGATSTNGGIGVEVAQIAGETEILDADFEWDGTLYGINAQFQMGSTFRLEGRGLTGNLEHDIGGIESEEPSYLLEGEATLGFAPWEGTRLFAGIGYRYFEVEPDLSIERTSHNFYVPVGVSVSDRIGDTGWVGRTTLKAGLIPYGEEKLEGNISGVGSVSDTFHRSSGWMLGVSSEIGTALGGGLLSIEPFVRHFEQGDTDQEDGMEVQDIGTTEFGFRINYRI